ncbi:molybdopterin-dependent oxidoreductase [Spirochaetota bacterium]
METKYTFCRICECLCGLKVTIENNRVIKIEPDKEHITTKGHSCIKGTRQHKIYSSPDRIKYPMKRTGNKWDRISWDEALGEIGSKVKNILKDSSPNSIAAYVGTTAGFGVLHPAFAQGFMTGIGSYSMYSPHTQDCANKFLVSRQMYGFPFTLPFPDIINTNFMIIAGGNPAISKFSFLQLPHPLKRLKEIIKRGGRVIFIDPRKTESAKAVGEHIFIRPNTDVFFYLSFLRELLEKKAIDYNKIQKYMTGFEKLRSIVEPWSPEKSEMATGIPAETLRQIFKSYIQADGAALYSSTGVSMGTNGTIAFWLQEVINAVSGNLDRFGGTLVARGIMEIEKLGKKQGFLLNNEKSRIGGFQSVSDCFPGGILADEILTPGKEQVKALFVTGGNPVNTMANSSRTMDAMKKLELLVSIDILRNETASLAHYILPSTSFFEQPGIPFVFPLMCGLQLVPYLQGTETLVQPDGEQRHSYEIFIDLAKASGTKLFGSSIARGFFNLNQRILRLKGFLSKLALTKKNMLSLLLRFSGQGGFKKLLKHPHGVFRPPHREKSFLGKRVITGDGKVNLAPRMFVDFSKKLEDDYQNELKDMDSLKLISRRARRTHNSWMHNIKEFAQGKFITNYLYMNPVDAEKRGLKAGDMADVSSETGTVRLPVLYLEELMPGAVALPHGWGHQHANGLSIASAAEGVNVNILSADGPEKIERLSGMAHLTGIPVEVKPAAGPRDTSSWSGIAVTSTRQAQ